MNTDHELYSRGREPRSNSSQNLYVIHEGIIEAGCVEEDQTVALETRKARNRIENDGRKVRCTRVYVVADLHLLRVGAESKIDELRKLVSTNTAMQGQFSLPCFFQRRLGP
jgi:hypothetical protein